MILYTDFWEKSREMGKYFGDKCDFSRKVGKSGVRICFVITFFNSEESNQRTPFKGERCCRAVGHKIKRV